MKGRISTRRNLGGQAWVCALVLLGWGMTALAVPPTIAEARWFDINSNGSLDRVVLIFDQTVDVNNPGGGGNGFPAVNITSVNGPVAIDNANYNANNVGSLVLNFLGDEIPGTDLNGLVSLFYVAIAGNEIENNVVPAQPLADSSQPTATLDSAAPVILNASYFDSDNAVKTADGKIDLVTVNVSESLDVPGSTLAQVDWTINIAGVNITLNLGLSQVNGQSLDLHLNQLATIDTNGPVTVEYEDNGNILDLAGNSMADESVFNARDRAGPAPVLAIHWNGVAQIVFSEPVVDALGQVLANNPILVRPGGSAFTIGTGTVFDLAAPNQAPNASNLAITEFMNDPTDSEPGDEWVELFNYGPGTLDLSDFLLTEGVTSFFMPAVTLAAGEYVILAADPTEFGNNWPTVTTTVLGPWNLSELGNAAGGLTLQRVADLAVIWRLGYEADGTEGRATFLSVNDFTTTDYGTQATPGINRNGLDVTLSLGFQSNDATTDASAFLSVDGDFGSPGASDLNATLPLGNANHGFDVQAVTISPVGGNTSYTVIGFDNRPVFTINGAASSLACNSQLGVTAVQATAYDQGGLSNAEFSWSLHAGAVAIAGNGVGGANFASLFPNVTDTFGGGGGAGDYHVAMRFNDVTEGARRKVTHGDSAVPELVSVTLTNPIFPGFAQEFSFSDEQGTGENPESSNVFAIVKATPLDPPSQTSRLFYKGPNHAEAIIGIDLADGTTTGSLETLDQITVHFVDASNGQHDPQVDLQLLGDDDTSGVLVFRTRAIGGQPAGVVQLSTTGLEWSEWRINAEGHAYRAVTLKALAPMAIPPNDVGENDPADYEIRIQLRDQFNMSDSFYIEIPDEGFLFASGSSADDFDGDWNVSDGGAGILQGSNDNTVYVFQDANLDNRWNASEAIQKLTGINLSPFYDGGTARYQFDLDDPNLLNINQTATEHRGVYFSDVDGDGAVTSVADLVVFDTATPQPPPGTPLRRASEVSVAPGQDPGGDGGLYYFDANGSNNFDAGDEVIFKANVNFETPGQPVFDGAHDFALDVDGSLSPFRGTPITPVSGAVLVDFAPQDGVFAADLDNADGDFSPFTGVDLLFVEGGGAAGSFDHVDDVVLLNLLGLSIDAATTGSTVADSVLKHVDDGATVDRYDDQELIVRDDGGGVEDDIVSADLLDGDGDGDADDDILLYDGGDGVVDVVDTDVLSIFNETDTLVFYDLNNDGFSIDEDDIFFETPTLTVTVPDQLLTGFTNSVAPGIVMANAASESQTIPDVALNGDAGSLGGLYYFDADGNGYYSTGDDIVFKPNISVVGTTLVFDGATDLGIDFDHALGAGAGIFSANAGDLLVDFVLADSVFAIDVDNLDADGDDLTGIDVLFIDNTITGTFDSFDDNDTVLLNLLMTDPELLLLGATVAGSNLRYTATIGGGFGGFSQIYQDDDGNNLVTANGADDDNSGNPNDDLIMDDGGDGVDVAEADALMLFRPVDRVGFINVAGDGFTNGVDNILLNADDPVFSSAVEDDFWYDVGGQLGVYDAGFDVPMVGNASRFYRQFSPVEEGARAYRARGAAPATVEDLVALDQGIAANSEPTAIAGINMHDSGRAFSPRIPGDLDATPLDLNYAVTVEAVSKNVIGGLHSLSYLAGAGTLSFDGGTPVVINAADGHYLLPGLAGDVIVVDVIIVDLATVDADVVLTVSDDSGRDVDQPTSITGVVGMALGRGNTLGANALGFTADAVGAAHTLSWAGGTPVLLDVNDDGVSDASDNGIYVLNPSDDTHILLRVRIQDLPAGSMTETLDVHPADGRNVSPFDYIDGLELMGVAETIDIGPQQFDFDPGTGELSWLTSDPLAEMLPLDVAGLDGGEYGIVSLDDHFILVRRQGAAGSPADLPVAATSDVVFVNQTVLGRVSVVLSNIDGFAATTHLLSLANSKESGLAVYRDTNGNGLFDGGNIDQFVALTTVPEWNTGSIGSGVYSVDLDADTLLRAPYLPGTQEDPAGNNDYFLVVKTSADISFGDQFRLLTFFAREHSEPNTRGENVSCADFVTWNNGPGNILTANTVTNTVFSDETHSSQKVDAGETTPIALFAIDHWIRNAEVVRLEAITFTFNDISGTFDPNVDINTVDGQAADSGILIYTDNGNGVFNPLDDTQLTYSFIQNGNSFTVYPSNPILVPQNDASPGVNDVFVAFLPSAAIGFGDAFTVTILAANGLEYTTGFGSPNGDLTTNVITATVPTLYQDLTTHTQLDVPGIIINSSVAANGEHSLSLFFDPATGGYQMALNGGPAVDVSAGGRFTLDDGGNSIDVTFMPSAFEAEDGVLDVDGSTTSGVGGPAQITQGARLVPLDTVSVAAAGVAVGGAGALYFVDVDGSGALSMADEFVLKTSPELAGTTLVYDPDDATDWDGDSASDDGDVVILDRDGVINAQPGDALWRFTPANQLAFEQGGTLNAYDDGEDIIRDTDGFYNLLHFDHAVDLDGSFTQGRGSAVLALPGDILHDAAIASVAAGGSTPNNQGAYYNDLDGSGSFTPGDEIILKHAISAITSLHFDANPAAAEDGDATAALDLVLFDGGDGILDTVEGDLLSQFVTADLVAYHESGASPTGFDDRDDIFRDIDGIYNPPVITRVFRVTDARSIRRYTPTAPAPFDTAESAFSGIIGIDVANSGAPDLSLESLQLRFIDHGGFNANTDLRFLAIGVNGGVQVHRDADGNGIFEPHIDTMVPLSEVPVWSGLGTTNAPYTMTLSLAEENSIDDFAIDHKYDFFVVVQPSPTANNSQEVDIGDMFSIRIDAGDIAYSQGTNQQTITSSTVTIDSKPPTILDVDIDNPDGDPWANNITFTFSETLQINNEDVDDWVLTAANGDDLTPTLESAITLATDAINITLTNAAGDTGPISYQIDYDGDSLAILDLAGNPALNITAQSNDNVPPVILGATVHDRNQNGFLDALTVTLSESVDDSSMAGGYLDIFTPYGPTQWTISGGYANFQIDPNGPNDDLAEEDNNVLHFTFDEGVAFDTGFLPELTTGGATLSDLSGNALADIADPGADGLDYGPGDVIEVDLAPPVLVDAFSNTGLTGGNIPAGATITAIFSESVVSGASFTFSDFGTDSDGPGGEVFASPAFDNSISPGLAINGLGQLEITLANPTTDGDWLEGATMNFATPTLANADALEDAAGLDAIRNPDLVNHVEIRGLGSLEVTAVLTLDSDANGFIDGAQVTFNKNIDDSTLQGFPGVGGVIDVLVNGNHWQFTGRSTISILLAGPSGTDVSGNNILFFTFDESVIPDTGDTPALNVINNPTLSSVNGEAIVNALAPTTTDGAAPQILDVSTEDGNGDGSADQARIVFSENMDDSSVTPADFAVSGLAGVGFNTDATADDDTFIISHAGVVGTAYQLLDYLKGVTTDLAGVPLESVTDAGLRNKVDSAAPQVVAARTLSDSSIEITFSENVSNVDAGDLFANDRTSGPGLGAGAISFTIVTPTSGSVYVFSGANATWNTDATGVAVGAGTDSSGTGQTTLANIHILVNAIIDLAGNFSPLIDDSGNFNVTTDGAPPVIIVATTSDVNGDGSVDSATLKLSEAVSDASISAPEFAIGGVATVAFSTGTFADDDTIELTHPGVSGTEYKAIDYSAGTASDLGGNLLLSGTDLGATQIDDASPVIVSAATLSDSTVSITFSEVLEVSNSVAVRDALSVNTGAINFSGGSVNVSGNPVIVWSGASGTWNTDANGLSTGTGTDASGANQSGIPDLTLANATLADPSGNGVGAVVELNITRDAAPPLVLYVDSTVASAIYTTNNTVPVVVEFTERVTVNVALGVPSIELRTSPVATTIVSLSAGNGSSRLDFSYTVALGDDRIAPFFLDYINANSLQTNGAVITDTAVVVNTAILTLPAPGATNSLSDRKNIEIDTSPPFVVVARTIDDDTVEVTFNEPVAGDSVLTGIAAGEITLSDGRDYDSASLDAANTQTPAGAFSVIIYLHTTDPADAWNTDATGASAGNGTDANGVPRNNRPEVNIATGAIADRISQTILNTNFNAVDNAPPVLIGGSYSDLNGDGVVDTATVNISEDVTFNNAVLGNWTFVPNDLTGLAGNPSGISGANSASITLNTPLSAGVTGVNGGVEPTAAFADGGAGGISDLSPANNAMQDTSPLTLADKAGPALRSVRVASRKRIEVNFSENVDDSTVATTDYLITGFTTPGFNGTPDGIGTALLNDSVTYLLITTEISIDEGGRLDFVGDVSDGLGNGNSDPIDLDIDSLRASIDLAGPADGAILGGQIDVTGSARAASMTSWGIFYALAPAAGQQEFLLIAQSIGAPADAIDNAIFTQVPYTADGNAQWDLSGIADGTYVIRLRAVMTDPFNMALDETPVDVDHTVIIDQNGAFVLNVSSSNTNGLYSGGQTVNVDVQFNENVHIGFAAGAPELTAVATGDNPGESRFTTGAPHGFNPGDRIIIGGVDLVSDNDVDCNIHAPGQVPPVSNLPEFYSARGDVVLAVTGSGSTFGGNFMQIEKPSNQATVRAAFVMATSSRFRGDAIADGDISFTFNFGISYPLNWDVKQAGDPANGVYNYRADVTDLFASELDGQIAGLHNVSFTETNSLDVDGEILAIVWNDPAATEQRLINLHFGFQAVAGDHFIIDHGQSIDPFDFSLEARLGLGISTSLQQGGAGSITEVDVNSIRITSAAGGHDDGFAQNGGLLTVGDFSDDSGNPLNAFSGPVLPLTFQYDDEAYDLLGFNFFNPFLNADDTSIRLDTRTPTNDANLFFAWFQYQGALTPEATDYDGVYTVINATPNTFDIVANFVPTDLAAAGQQADRVPIIDLGTSPVRQAYYESRCNEFLTFRYDIVDGDTASILDYTTTSALQHRGATEVHDIAVNLGDVALPGPGAVGSLADNKEVSIGPRMVILSPTDHSPLADELGALAAVNYNYADGAIVPITVRALNTLTPVQAVQITVIGEHGPAPAQPAVFNAATGFFEYDLNLGDDNTWPDNDPTTPWNDGIYTIQVLGTDTAGDVSVQSVLITFLRDIPKADILSPPQDTVLRDGETVTADFIVADEFVPPGNFSYTLQGATNPGFTGNLVTLASGNTAGTFTSSSFTLDSVSHGPRYYLRLQATNDEGDIALVIHRLTIATGIRDVVTDDIDGNGQIDQLTVNFAETVDISDLGGTSDGFPAINIAGYTIADGNYEVANTASVVLGLTESGIPDTGTTPLVTLVNSLDVVLTTDNGLAIPDFAASAIDGAAPVLIGALTRDDRSIAATFSESVTVDSLGSITTTGEGGASAFGSQDSPGSVVTFSAGAAIWNTDATGAAPGTGTDADGVSHVNALPTLNLLADAVSDGAANGNLLLTNFANAGDGAPPVPTGALYLDYDFDLQADAVDITFSEPPTLVYEDVDWSIALAGAVNLQDDTGASAAGSVVTLDIVGDPGATGGTPAPQVDYSEQGALGGLTDALGNITGDFLVTVADGVGPVLQSGRIIGGFTIELIFSESIDDTNLDDTDFVTTGGLTNPSASTGGTANDNIVYLTDTVSVPAGLITVALATNGVTGDLGGAVNTATDPVAIAPLDIRIDTPANNAIVAGSLTIATTINTPLLTSSELAIQPLAGVYSVVTSPLSTVGVDDGPYDLRLQANLSDGSQIELHHSIVIDNLTPSISFDFDLPLGLNQTRPGGGANLLGSSDPDVAVIAAELQDQGGSTIANSIVTANIALGVVTGTVQLPINLSPSVTAVQAVITVGDSAGGQAIFISASQIPVDHAPPRISIAIEEAVQDAVDPLTDSDDDDIIFGIINPTALHAAWNSDDTDIAQFEYRVCRVPANAAAFPHDRFTLVPNALSSARTLFGTAALSNGDALVIAGWNGSVALDSVQRYDGVSNSWGADHSLNTARRNHSVITLNDDSVYAIGGIRQGQFLNSVEVRDSGTGQWSASWSLNTGRMDHGSIVLPNGRILAIGGQGNAGILASVEVFDPAFPSLGWSNTGALNTARAEAEIVWFNGAVLAIGGRGTNGSLASVESYNPNTGLWTPLAPLNAARVYHRAVVVNDGIQDKVLVIAGRDGANDVPSAEIFDGTTWGPTGSISVGRAFFATAQLSDGQVLAMGGISSVAGVLSSVDLYDPITNTWNLAGNTDEGALNTPRFSHREIVLQGVNGPAAIMVVGGTVSGGFSGSIEARSIAQPLTPWSQTTLTRASVTPATAFAGAPAPDNVGLLDGVTYCFQVRATDGSGHRSPPVTTDGIVADFSDPNLTVAVASGVGSPTNASPIPFTVSFNKEVSGFDQSDLVITNGIGINFAPITTDMSWSIGVVPSGDGTVTVTVPANSATDDNGTANSQGAHSVTSDRTAPVAAVSTAAGPTNADPILFAVDFGEVVNGLILGDIAVSNGAAGNLQNLGGGSFTVEITPSADGDVTVTIAGAVATDTAGSNNIGDSATVTADLSDPGVSVDLQVTNSGAPTVTGGIDTASADLASFVVSIGGLPALSFGIDDGSGTWTAETDPAAFVGDGLYEVVVTATDLAGNVGTDASFTEITIDQTGPVDPSIASATPDINQIIFDNSIDLIWNAGSDALSGVAGYSWEIDTSPSTVPDQVVDGATLPNQITIGPADGNYFVHVSTLDNAGNWTSTFHYGPWEFFAQPLVRVTLQGPSAPLSVGETFQVEVYIEEHSVDASGIRGGPLDITFDAPQIAYNGTFSPATILQAPYDDFAGQSSGSLGPGLIDELGGVTTQVGFGDGVPVLYAVLDFVATSGGNATIASRSGESGFSLPPPVGQVPIELIDFGTPLQLTIEPGITLSVVENPASLAESGGICTIRATTAQTSAVPIIVHLDFAGQAVSGTDYSVPGTSITIPAANFSADLVIQATGDALHEANESIDVSIASVVNGVASSNAIVSCTILDDDPAPTVDLSASANSMPENGGAVSITAHLNAVAGVPVIVDLAFSGGATSGTDYSASGSSITIAAGDLSGDVQLTAINDVSGEGNELIDVDIVGVTNGIENGVQTAAVEIADDDFGNFDSDPEVGINDLIIFLGFYNSTQGDGTYDARGDFDADGDIDFNDLVFFIGVYGNTYVSGARSAGATIITSGPREGEIVFITLIGPAGPLAVGDTFGLDLYVQTSHPNGFGGVKLDLSFVEGLVSYAGVFDSSTIVQAPFNVFDSSGNLSTGEITGLGGGTINGVGVGSPAHFATLNFTATAPGVASFATAPSDIGITILGGGTLEASAVTFGDYSVTIQGSNQAPVAHDVNANGRQNQPIVIDLQGTDSDDDALSFDIPTDGDAGYPEHGDLSVSPARGSVVQTVTYTPDADFAGEDSFTYTVNDGSVDSNLGIVDIRIGFSSIITVRENVNTFGSLTFGAFAGASNGFAAVDGDNFAPPTSPNGSQAYLLLDSGEKLSDDIRANGDPLQWKLLVTVPSGGIGWSLNWTSEGLAPDGRSTTLTPADAVWAADGSAIDMLGSETIALAPGTHRFLLTVTEQVSQSWQLDEAWLLLGTNLDPNAATQDAIANHNDILAIYNWNPLLGYEAPNAIQPFVGYWIMGARVGSVNLVGTPADSSAGILLQSGWNLISPPTALSSPVDGVTILSAWVWDPVAGYTEPVMLQAGSAYWVYAAEEITIWSSQ